MLSLKFLLIRAERLLISGQPVGVAYFCEIAADLAAEHGTTDQEVKCRNAARMCQEQATAHLMSMC